MNDYIPVEDEEEEINIGKVFWAVCRRWRNILLAMLLMALLAAGAKGLLTVLNPTEEEEKAAQITAYETLVANNEQAIKETRNTMTALAKSIADQTDYIENSVYMKIDPYNVAVASATYVIKTDYEILPEMTYQNVDYTNSVVNAYVSVLTSESFLQPLCDETGMELRYLKELISVWNGSATNASATNGSAGMLQLKVQSPNTETSEKIMDFLMQGINENQNSIEKAVSEHTVEQLTYNSFTTVNTGIDDTQQAKRETLSEDMEQVSELQETLTDLQEKKIEVPAAMNSSVVKSLIKFAVIGAFLGAVLACGVIILQVCFRDTIYSASVVEDKEHLHILGTLAADPEKLKKYGKLDAYIRKKEGKLSSSDEEQDCSLIGAYLERLAEGKSPVFVTGQVDPQRLSEIVEKLKKYAPSLAFVDGGNLLKDPQSVKKLAESASVLLMEETNISRHSLIEKECKMVQSLNKEILGAIVIED